MVQHHLDLAKAAANQQDVDESLLSTNVEELKDSVQQARDLDKRDSFKRVSPELFTKIASFCDSSSLAMVTGASKSWRSSILGDKEFFRSFKMRGKLASILGGLEYFREKCNNSIHSIEIEVEDFGISEFEGKAFKRRIDELSKSLRSLVACHRGGLGRYLLEGAEQCPLLCTFSSTRIDAASSSFILPSQTSQSYHSSRMSGKWKPQQLETFVWNCGSVDLQCDKNVCNVLRKAKVVEICSHGIQQDFVLNLLSQPSLIKVKVPYFLEPKDRQKVDIPRLNLPNLTDLTLAFPLLNDSEYEKEKVFFQQLEVPSLQCLWLGSVKSPLYLGHLGSLPDLKVLDIGTFGYADDQAEDVEISVDLLLQNIYRWDSIEELSLRVGGERGSDFTNSTLR